MVKEKEVKSPKTKGKEDITFLDLSKSAFKNDIFLKKLPFKIVGVFALIQIVILTIIAIISNNVENSSRLSDINLVFGILIIIAFGMVAYGLFYVFLNAFGEERKPFFESFLVSLIITLNTVILGNLFNLIGKYTWNETIIMIATFMFLVLSVYYLIYFNISFKKYYNLSIFKVLTSFILTIMTFMFIIIFLESLKTFFNG